MCYLPRGTQQLVGFEPWHSVSSHVLRSGLSMAGVLRGLRGSRGTWRVGAGRVDLPPRGRPPLASPIRDQRAGPGRVFLCPPHRPPALLGLSHAGGPSFPEASLHASVLVRLPPGSCWASPGSGDICLAASHLHLTTAQLPPCLRNAPAGHRQPQETQRAPRPLVPPWAQASLKPHRPVLNSAPATILA